MMPVLAICVGASLGALLRWRLTLWLNGLSPVLPYGTLTANLVGGYLVGVAVAVLAHRPEWPPEVRLLVITGFLGGLTTFSTFSAEVVERIARGDLVHAALEVAAHLAGSLLLTALGIATVDGLRRGGG